jgi:hypothetical protein
MIHRRQSLFRCLGTLALVVQLLVLAPGNAAAQNPEDKLGSWFGATSAIRFSDRWSLFLQGELRTWEMAHNLNETLFRFAGHYDFSPKVMGAFGYVRVDTWPFTERRGLRKFYENRFYQELLFKQKVRNGGVKHRFRLEQRWLKVEGQINYSNRARYMLNYTRPLNNATMKPGTWFVQAFDEVFVDFDTNGYWFNPVPYDKGLNQNRLYFGGGRQLKSLSNIRFGLLWQHRPDIDVYRLVLSYSHNFDRRTK